MSTKRASILNGKKLTWAKLKRDERAGRIKNLVVHSNGLVSWYVVEKDFVSAAFLCPLLRLVLEV